MGKLPKLTAKQATFVKEYLIDGNGRRSAIMAGYSENTASEMAYENLRKPQIMKHILSYQLKNDENFECKLKDAMDCATQIMRAKLSDYYLHNVLKPMNQWPFPLAVESFDYEKNWIKLRDPMRAVDTASRLCGWDQRVQEDDKNINVTVKYVGNDPQVDQ